MLKQQKEIFGADDWLAQELRRESKISAWDMDGGRFSRNGDSRDARRLAAEHVLDCDADSVAREHRAEHASRQTIGKYREATDGNAGSSVKLDKKTKTALILLGVFVGLPLLPVLAPLLPLILIGYAVYASKKNQNR